MQIGTQVFKYPTDVSILQGKTKLNPEKSETHIPNLPIRKLRFFHATNVIGMNELDKLALSRHFTENDLIKVRQDMKKTYRVKQTL